MFLRMKKIIILLSFLFLSACSFAQQAGYNSLRTDTTLRNAGQNKTGVDTVKWIATKHDLTTISGSGIDSVTRVANNNTI